MPIRLLWKASFKTIAAVAANDLYKPSLGVDREILLDSFPPSSFSTSRLRNKAFFKI